MKNVLLITIVSLMFAACGPDKPKEETEDESTAYNEMDQKENAVAKNANAGKGIGQVKQVTLNTPLEQERIPRGKAIYEMKCQGCHKLDEQRVVGPGWKDVTKKRKPEWIMNMITNV